MGDDALTEWVPFEEMKKRGFCIIKGNPCRVTDITAKVKGTGASANDRVVISGTHIFTGVKSVDTINLTNAHDGLEVPITSKKQYMLLDVDSDTGFVSLLTDEGETKEDAQLSRAQGDADEQAWDVVGAETVRRFSEGESLKLTLLSIMGKDLVVKCEQDPG